MNQYGLSDYQWEIVVKTLTPILDQVESIDVFGSRATGKARSNSDIDLVLRGTSDRALVNRLWTDFQESALPIKVDICAYDLIDYPPFKTHIDKVSRPFLIAEKCKINQA